MLIIAHSYALHCPSSHILKVNLEQWLLLSGGFRYIKAGWARRKGEGQYEHWVECQESWQERAARKLWPIFQLKHESLNRDALEINSFPVHCPVHAETTPSSSFVSGHFGVCFWEASGEREIKMASLRRPASLEVVFTAWPSVNCKQLEVVPPLLFSFKPSTCSFCLSPQTNHQWKIWGTLD